MSMISPLYMTAMRSESAMISSNSALTSKHGDALVALGDDLVVDELDRADVDAARRLRGDQQLDRAAELARHHHLLLVAAGETAAVRVDAGGAHIEFFDQRFGVFGDGALLMVALWQRAAGSIVEHQVIGDRVASTMP
jgi:hypothetical protein